MYSICASEHTVSNLRSAIFGTKDDVTSVTAAPTEKNLTCKLLSSLLHSFLKYLIPPNPPLMVIISYFWVVTMLEAGGVLNSWVQWVVDSPESQERCNVHRDCHKAESDSETCNWCLDSLSAEDIQQRNFEENPCLWKELVRKYDAREVIHIAVRPRLP